MKISDVCFQPGLSEEVRRSLGEAAVKAARAVSYVGAGKWLRRKETSALCDQLPLRFTYKQPSNKSRDLSLSEASSYLHVLMAIFEDNGKTAGMDSCSSHL